MTHFDILRAPTTMFTGFAFSSVVMKTESHDNKPICVKTEQTLIAVNLSTKQMHNDSLWISLSHPRFPMLLHMAMFSSVNTSIHVNMNFLFY